MFVSDWSPLNIRSQFPSDLELTRRSIVCSGSCEWELPQSLPGGRPVGSDCPLSLCPPRAACLDFLLPSQHLGPGKRSSAMPSHGLKS